MIRSKNFLFLVKFIVLLLAFSIVYVELRNPEFKIIDYLKLLDLKTFIICFTLVFLGNFFQIEANRKVIEYVNNCKINFIYFSKIFINNQILNLLVPHLGVLYKGYLLKKIDIKYTCYTTSIIYLILFGVFFSFFLFSIEVFFFGSILSHNKIIVSFFLFLISVVVFLIFKYGFLLRNFFQKKVKKLNFLSKLLNILFLYNQKIKQKKKLLGIISFYSLFIPPSVTL